MRVGVYHRIARPDATAVCSKELLREQWYREADQYENMIIADYYFDDSPVGTATSPERDRLLADCRAGKIDIVMVRSMKHLNPDHGIRPIIVHELIRLEPPVGVYFAAEPIHYIGSKVAALMKPLKEGEI